MFTRGEKIYFFTPWGSKMAFRGTFSWVERWKKIRNVTQTKHVSALYVFMCVCVCSCQHQRSSNTCLSPTHTFRMVTSCGWKAFSRLIWWIVCCSVQDERAQAMPVSHTKQLRRRSEADGRASCSDGPVSWQAWQKWQSIKKKWQLDTRGTRDARCLVNLFLLHGDEGFGGGKGVRG